MQIVKSLFAAMLSGVWLITSALAGDDVRSEIKLPITASSSKTMESAQEKVTDAWITAKVKSSFMYSKNVAASDIQVDTADGIVTLSGNVDADSSKDIAIELASTVHGVRKVNSTELLVRDSYR